MRGLGVSPTVSSIGPVIDPVSAAEYGLPADAYPVAQSPSGIPPCQTTENALTGEQDPSEPFYSPSTTQYYCGPVQYTGSGSAPSATGWIVAGLIAAGLWWYFGGKA
jgi:hypothetical protein